MIYVPGSFCSLFGEKMAACHHNDERGRRPRSFLALVSIQFVLDFEFLVFFNIYYGEEVNR